jgi:hypothetical protein
LGVEGNSPAVEEGQDVGVLEIGGGLDFAQEAVSAECGGKLGAKELDGDEAVVLEVAGEVDGGHATATEFTLDAVAIDEGGLQRRQGIRHARTDWGQWQDEGEEAGSLQPPGFAM